MEPRGRCSVTEKEEEEEEAKEEEEEIEEKDEEDEGTSVRGLIRKGLFLCLDLRGPSGQAEVNVVPQAEHSMVNGYPFLEDHLPAVNVKLILYLVMIPRPISFINVLLMTLKSVVFMGIVWEYFSDAYQ